MPRQVTRECLNGCRFNYGRQEVDRETTRINCGAPEDGKEHLVDYYTIKLVGCDSFRRVVRQKFSGCGARSTTPP